MSTNSNTVLLKQYANARKEAIAIGIITPGDLVMFDSAGKVLRHGTDKGVNVLKMFALENTLEGEEITDTYAVGDRVKMAFVRTGDEVYAIIQDGEKIAIGDVLVSAGDGALEEYSDAGTPIAIAKEAVSPSGSDGRCRVIIA